MPPQNTYVFATKVYDDFDNGTYAAFNTLRDFMTLGVLLIFVPLVLPRIGAHESLLLTFLCLLDALGYLTAAFTKETWELFVTQAITPMFRDRIVTS
jgi:hypothetical protein